MGIGHEIPVESMDLPAEKAENSPGFTALNNLSSALGDVAEERGDKPYDYLAICTEAVKKLKPDDLKALIKIDKEKKYLPEIHGGLHEIIANLAKENPSSYDILLNEYGIDDEITVH